MCRCITGAQSRNEVAICLAEDNNQCFSYAQSLKAVAWMRKAGHVFEAGQGMLSGAGTEPFP